MATHSSILASKNHMGRGAWWATVHGTEESDAAEHTLVGHRQYDHATK